jgi:hypothetical protein
MSGLDWSEHRKQSEYGWDPRVLWTLNPSMPAQAPDWSNDTCHSVRREGNGFVVHGVTDPGTGELWRFASVDEALRALLGAPVRSMLDHDEYLAAVQNGMPADAGNHCTIQLIRLEDGNLEAVGTVIWMGGFAILHRWAGDLEGLTAAGEWAVARCALWAHNGFQVRSVEDLTEHIS